MNTNINLGDIIKSKNIYKGQLASLRMQISISMTEEATWLVEIVN
jgi:hypothetical protein